MAEELKFKSTGDEETDKVLAQMAEEGVELPEFGKPEPKAEEEKVETPSEEDEAEEESDLEPTKDEDAEELEGGSDEEEDVETPKPIVRTSVAELKKAEYWKEKARKLEKQLSQINTDNSSQEKVSEDIDAEIESFAKQQNIDVSAAKKLIELSSKKAIPAELRSALEKTLESDKERAFWNSERESFDADFESNVIPLMQSLNPNLTQAEVDKAYDSLDSAAWFDGNEEKSLVSLFLELNKQPAKRKGGESSNVRSVAKSLNLDSPSEEDLESILESGSDEEFEKLSESLASKSPKLNK